MDKLEEASISGTQLMQRHSAQTNTARLVLHVQDTGKQHLLHTPSGRWYPYPMITDILLFSVSLYLLCLVGWSLRPEGARAGIIAQPISWSLH